MTKPHVLRFAAALSLTLLAGALCGAAAQTPDARREAFGKLLAEHWAYSLARSPEYASTLGDRRWNDRLSDASQKARDEHLSKTKEYLARFEAVDTKGFPAQEALSHRLMVRRLREEIENARFKNWRMPANQLEGPQVDFAETAARFPFATAKDYEDFISRLKQFPKFLEDNVAQMRAGMAEGLMPPKFILDMVTAQALEMAALKPEETPFMEPLSKFPQEIPDAARAGIRERTLAAIRDGVLPAYAKFARFMKEEYAPRGRKDVGVWALPDGAARYSAEVKRNTTTNLTPEQIHRIGLEQVAAIEKQMLAVAARLGHRDLKSLNAAIEQDPKLRAGTRENILNLYRRHLDAMRLRLPKLFGRLPKAGMEVVATEPFLEATAPFARYYPGSADGARPGRVVINTSKPETRKTITVEAIAYHEGVPGHHMQIAIAQELTGLPAFRQNAWENGYGEGWALYTEKLAQELGFYSDPYSEYGRLQSEMHRAIRLVVDTGLHHKRWTREQVVQYFHDHSAIDEVTVQTETDRYIAWPGQALGYKIGELKILELRERARKALGKKFDLRQFHDEVLGSGVLPLDVLEELINEWIKSQSRLR
ncbi:MAG TPA: DUF885 family protein [Pyrinomonadaceae bacterium]|nr:DUF885 family protein [Pyrinomonadaceae bacterium]